MITIQTDIGGATLDDDGFWTAENLELLDVCLLFGQLRDVPAHIPEPQVFAADAVIDQVGGRIVEYAPDLISLEEGAIE